ncbi:ATP-binding protein [Giardia duodenalis]|uniref:GPN-loop GTPase n=1 Tax=Giardia intestinalis (strain ATCC 50803 / WB clone C6) TaxID=184922 RepID=A8B4B6_GIAIC|nr:ATP-binding protein [Giardia intestinalis]KAE8303649.1 ATP-binding protein [Giardia intestinalis]|eukprot:XP_001709547.1 ATP-binding protein [Giardia lamblia ATCC 50803]
MCQSECDHLELTVVERQRIREMLHRPPVLLVIGMAGAGKTTFIQRLAAELNQHQAAYALKPRIRQDIVSKVPYIVNLDPAVLDTPYIPSVDIRDTFNIGDLMKKHHWGPNGAIMATLNLFATKIDELDNLMRKKAERTSCYVVDTPGQIEVFTWSSSGEIVSKFFGSAYPTILLYIVDSERCLNPITFVASMLYCCSIMERLELPVIIVFNKSDLIAPSLSVEPDTFNRWAPWVYMRNNVALSEAFSDFQERNVNSIAYSDIFYESLSTILEEFYNVIDYVNVSSYTGLGFEGLLDKIRRVSAQYIEEYPTRLDEHRRAVEQEKQQKEREKEDPYQSLFADMSLLPTRYVCGDDGVEVLEDSANLDGVD